MIVKLIANGEFGIDTLTIPATKTSSNALVAEIPAAQILFFFFSFLHLSDHNGISPSDG